MKNMPLISRFDEISKLEKGWHDGGGEPLNANALGDFANTLIDHFPDSLPLPHVFPTPDGDLSLEWEAVGDPTVLVDFIEKKAYFHAFDKDNTDIEEEFELPSSDNYFYFFNFLLNHIKVESI